MRDSEYYDNIERLAGLLCDTVTLLCGRTAERTVAGAAREGRLHAQKHYYDGAEEIYDKVEETAVRLLRAAAVDFITPIGRRDISDIVLAICRAARIASRLKPDLFWGREGGALSASCLRLAGSAREYAGLLRGLRRRGSMPSAAAYFTAAGINEKTSPKGEGTERNIWLARGGVYGLHEALMLYEGLCCVCEAIISSAYNNI